MFRRTLVIAALAAIASVAVPTAALADEYVPADPREPTLAGSTSVGECLGDAPWISYQIVLTDPDSLSTSHSATLRLTDGVNTETIPLGELQGNQLSGRVLWPGASVAADGTPTGWPGWERDGDTWVETDGNFAWTRGSITAELDVNPAISVPLSYPVATPDCVAGPPAETASASATSLSATGVSDAVLPISIGAMALVAAGGAVLLARRRPSRR